MRNISAFLPLLLLLGCASPRVPMPDKTGFEENPEAHRAYLEAYRAGYLARMSGEIGIQCSFGAGGLIGTASDIGWMRGQADAYKAYLRKVCRELEAEAARQKPQ
jgi:hypothetical protein